MVKTDENRTICTSCGGEIGYADNYCSHCGEKCRVVCGSVGLLRQSYENALKEDEHRTSTRRILLPGVMVVIVIVGIYLVTDRYLGQDGVKRSASTVTESLREQELLTKKAPAVQPGKNAAGNKDIINAVHTYGKALTGSHYGQPGSYDDLSLERVRELHQVIDKPAAVVSQDYDRYTLTIRFDQGDNTIATLSYSLYGASNLDWECRTQGIAKTDVPADCDL